MLIPKPNKPLGDPSSYRPICLLNGIGKLFERVIFNRLVPITEKEGGLSDRQFGFRKARSTVNAISTVTEIAEKAMEANKSCAVVTLDVKNAFNTAKWSKIIAALAKLGAPKYLVHIVMEFLRERILCYDSDDGPKTYTTTCGVPQGSVLGPLLWIIMYDGILKLQLPKGVTIIGFADDIGVTIVAQDIDEIEVLTNEAIFEIRSWLEEAGLTLAEHKTEVVLITKRRKQTSIKIRIGEHIIQSQPTLKYLGVMVDQRLKFKSHLENLATKASGVATLLARMLPNIGGPRQSRRLLISRVVSSILLYAAPVWASSLKVEANRRKIAAPYRLSALRTSCAYRTTSDEAACVIAGMIPIDILANEGRRLYDPSYAIGESYTNRRQLARSDSILEWQKRWDDSPKGRWTHRIIPDVSKWIKRRHGEVSYHLTQFLSGHGGYRAYLYRFGRDDSPYCPTCVMIPEDAEHVVFNCPRFAAHRAEAEIDAEARLTPENIVDHMLASETSWRAVEKLMKAIHNLLRREELRRKVTNNDRSRSS